MPKPSLMPDDANYAALLKRPEKPNSLIASKSCAGSESRADSAVLADR